MFERGIPHDPLPWLASALSTGVSYALEELTIVLNFPHAWRFQISSGDVGDVCAHEVWDKLDSVLSAYNYSQLKSVNITFNISGNMEPFKRCFAKRMPRLAAAGILHILQNRLQPIL
jgi:hypothetical protein